MRSVHRVRCSLALLVLLATLAAPLGAQHRELLPAGPRWAPPASSVRVPAQSRLMRADTSVERASAPRSPGPVGPDTCAHGPWLARLLLEPPSHAVAGAIAGWLVFTFSIGALAADHGTEYERSRRAFIRGGAIVGLSIGVSRLVTVPACPKR